MGDIRMDLLSDSLYDEEFENIMIEEGFTSAINTVTRPESGTCIDHIIFKMKIHQENLKSAVLHIDITDHYPVTLAVGIHGPASDGRKVEERTNLRYVDYRTLNSVLSSMSWESVCGAADVESATGECIGVLSTCISDSTKPLKQGRRLDNEWNHKCYKCNKFTIQKVEQNITTLSYSKNIKCTKIIQRKSSRKQGIIIIRI
ncbi:hypothetical protein HHI36_016360 [Cryptolaemus montrouzieri]|uniref:Endonuclease/exonuclease/phosphatase domain-containing protein n=1 Tax=Cryptolaemus montrouzieri TaxID=559131 RepID=A0ABD2NKA6_9CUCU